MTGGIRDTPREWVLEVLVGQDGWLPSTFNAESDGSLTQALHVGHRALASAAIGFLQPYRLRNTQTDCLVIL